MSGKSTKTLLRHDRFKGWLQFRLDPTGSKGLDYQLSASIQNRFDIPLSGRYQIIFYGRNRGMLPQMYRYGDFDEGCEFAVVDYRNDQVLPLVLCIYSHLFLHFYCVLVHRFSLCNMATGFQVQRYPHH
jgi:hypothetical protein